MHLSSCFTKGPVPGNSRRGKSPILLDKEIGGEESPALSGYLGPITGSQGIVAGSAGGGGGLRDKSLYDMSDQFKSVSIRRSNRT